MKCVPLKTTNLITSDETAKQEMFIKINNKNSSSQLMIAIKISNASFFILSKFLISKLETLFTLYMKKLIQKMYTL